MYHFSKESSRLFYKKYKIVSSSCYNGIVRAEGCMLSIDISGCTKEIVAALSLYFTFGVKKGIMYVFYDWKKKQQNRYNYVYTELER